MLPSSKTTTRYQPLDSKYFRASMLDVFRAFVKEGAISEGGSGKTSSITTYFELSNLSATQGG